MKKLVRNKIPIIIAEAGGVPKFRKVKGKERIKFLAEKLLEESIEVQEAITDNSNILEELADVFEVFQCLVSNLGYDMDDVRTEAEDKNELKGSFSDSYFLEEVE